MKEGLTDVLKDNFTLKASSVMVVERFSSVSIMIVLCLIGTTKSHKPVFYCLQAKESKNDFGEPFDGQACVYIYIYIYIYIMLMSWACLHTFGPPFLQVISQKWHKKFEITYYTCIGLHMTRQCKRA